jgi:hypothetical protein
MLLLTWHGTILRVEQTQSRLTHAPLIPVRDVSRDFQVSLESPPAEPTPVGAGMEMLAGKWPGTVHLRRGGLFLATDPAAPFPLCDQPEATAQNALLPLSAAEAAALRALLAGAWAVGDNADAVEPTLQPGFLLAAGDTEADLTRARITTMDGGTIKLELENRALTLWPRGARLAPDEWHLRQGPASSRGTPVPAAEDLHANAGTSLALLGGPEYFTPPMAVSRADTAWLFQDPALPRAGLHRIYADLVHEADVWVVLHAGMEGTVFSAAGMANAPPAMPDLPPYLAREAEELFVDTTALRNVPVLEGPHAVFYSAPAATWNGWLLGAIVNLALLRPALPPGTTLLIPGSLRDAGFDAVGALAAAGFGNMKLVEVTAPLCRVRDLYWLGRSAGGGFPAAAAIAVRDRALASRPAVAKRRVYVRQAARGVANAFAVESHCKRSGFETIDIEGLDASAQIALFQGAEFVAAMQGPALANLIFCPAEAKVIEFVPEKYSLEYSPSAFAMLTSQLHLSHGVLPCARRDDGTVQVDIDRLRAMLTILSARQ